MDVLQVANGEAFSVGIDFQYVATKLLVKFATPFDFRLSVGNVLSYRPVEMYQFLIDAYGCSVLHQLGTADDLLQQVLILLVLYYVLEFIFHFRLQR